MNNCGCCEANIFNEETQSEPLASSRTNTVLAVIQSLQPIAPNPSYIFFDPVGPQGLYDYNDSNGFWTITNITTITINHTGNYGVGLLMNLYNGVGPGTIVCQVHNLVQGAIGAVPPICSTQNDMVFNPQIQVGFWVSSASAYANAYLEAGSLIRVAYMSSVGCDVSPTSALSITLLDGSPGPQGIPGPPAPSVNIYNTDGFTTDPLRTLSVNAGQLDITGIAGSTLSLGVENFQLTTVPLNDNSLTSVLVRDPGVGLIKYRTIAVGPTNTIYSADDTLAGPRTITLGPFGNDLQFQMLNNKFVVKSAGSNLTADGLASTLSAVFVSSITLDAPTVNIHGTTNINLNPQPALEATATSVLTCTAAGNIRQRLITGLPIVATFPWRASTNAATPYVLTPNTFSYANVVDSTVSGPTTNLGCDLISSGWYVGYLPTNITFNCAFTAIASAAPVAGNITVSLWYSNKSNLIKPMPASTTLVRTITTALPPGGGGTISSSNTPAANYPLANTASSWNIVIETDTAINWAVVGSIIFRP